MYIYIIDCYVAIRNCVFNRICNAMLIVTGVMPADAGREGTLSTWQRGNVPLGVSDGGHTRSHPLGPQCLGLQGQEVPGLLLDPLIGRELCSASHGSCPRVHHVLMFTGAPMRLGECKARSSGTGPRHSTYL